MLTTEQQWAVDSVTEADYCCASQIDAVALTIVEGLDRNVTACEEIPSFNAYKMQSAFVSASQVLGVNSSLNRMAADFRAKTLLMAVLHHTSGMAGLALISQSVGQFVEEPGLFTIAMDPEA
jgi:hypothetical protein